MRTEEEVRGLIEELRKKFQEEKDVVIGEGMAYYSLIIVALKWVLGEEKEL